MQEKQLLDRMKTKRDNRRVEKRKSRRCFWTWPWGHIWGSGRTSYHRVCEICGAKSCKGTNDGCWKYDLACEFSTVREKAMLALLRKKRNMS